MLLEGKVGKCFSRGDFVGNIMVTFRLSRVITTDNTVSYLLLLPEVPLSAQECCGG